MEDGGWRMENGGWRIEDGEWRWRGGVEGMGFKFSDTRSDMHDFTTALKSASQDHQELVMMWRGCMGWRSWFVRKLMGWGVVEWSGVWGV